METIAGYIYSFFTSFLWAISAVGLGTLVSRNLKGANQTESILAAFLTGIVIWVVLGMILSVFHLFKAPILIAFLYITAIASIVAFLRTRPWRLSWKGLAGWPEATLAIVLLFQALYTLIPVTAFDALSYHLPIARTLLEAGTITWTPWIQNMAVPLNYEMLQAIGLAAGGYVSASLVSWWFSLLAILAVIAISERLGNRRAGIWTGLFLAITPLWFWLGHVPYTECGLAFGACMLLLGAISGWPGWLIGIASAWLMGQKYWGAELAVLGILVWIVQSRPGWRQVIVALAIAALVSGMWYIKNLYLFSNPFFPFFSRMYEFLGPPRVTESVFCSMDFSANRPPPHSLSGWIGLPIKLMMSPTPEYSDFGILSWKYIGWIFMLWPFSIFLIPTRNRAMGGVYAFVLMSTASWLFLHQYIYLRYLTVLLPLAYLIAVNLINEIVISSPLRSISRKPFVVILCILSIAHLFLLTMNRGLDQIPLTEEEREIFLEANIDGWPIIRELNRIEPEPVVYHLYGEGVIFYCDFPVYAGWRDPLDYGRFHEHASSGAELASWLEANGIDILLINERRVRQFEDPILETLGGSDFVSVYEPAIISYHDTTVFIHRGWEGDISPHSVFD